MKKLLAFLAFSGLFFVSCSDDDVITDPGDGNTPEPVEYTSGTADFSNYVALGNSLTAGYSDQALFIDGQEASLANLLASSFAEAGGGEFTTPFMADNLGGMTYLGQPLTGFGNRLILDFSSGSPTPVPVQGQGATEISNVLPGPFNNMGVPGAKSYHLLAQGYGNVAGVPLGLANPYFARFASSPNTSILEDALAQNPTFFTLWIGNNDVLGYAISGGTGIDQTGNPNPETYASNDITDPTYFGGVYNQILRLLTANGAQGVVANIPDVISIPFFTTVPHNPIPLDPATADFLNSAEAYGLYNGGLQQLQAAGLISAEEVARRTISFTAGEGNAVVIVDEDLTDLSAFGLENWRQATPEDLLVFTSQTVIGTLADPNNPSSVIGVGVPLEDRWVLTPEEQEVVNNTVTIYNQTIETLAQQYDLPVVDAYGYLQRKIEEGIPLADGSVVTDAYAVGGGFSLDGVHLTPRGNALAANEFIRVIEEAFGAVLPRVDPLDYTGLYIN